ncbi:MAG: hypothetical protein NZ742_01875 [Acidobacteria bacterium]|nr:hypothetical protein [Acidobacteriota bacterium]MDW7983087.1 hypothetical protein [Acidobacteriota bacterium]
MRHRSPTDSGIDADIERALTEWGQSVRETAELRSRHVRVDRTHWLQAILRPYHRWTWALRWAVGLAAIGLVGAGLYFSALRDRASQSVRMANSEWRIANGETRVQNREVPFLSRSLLPRVEDLWPDGPFDPELAVQVHTLLMALRQSGRTTCPDQADGLDFRSETEKVRHLYRTWALTAHRWDDPYGEVLRRLAVIVEPCLSPTQAQTLQVWSQDVNAYLYLAWPTHEK